MHYIHTFNCSLPPYEPLFCLRKLALLLLAAFLEPLCLLIRLIDGLTCFPLVGFARLHADSGTDVAAFLGGITDLALGVCPVGGAGSDLVSVGYALVKY